MKHPLLPPPLEPFDTAFKIHAEGWALIVVVICVVALGVWWLLA